MNLFAAIKHIRRISMNCSLPLRRECLHQLLTAIEDNRLIACQRHGEDGECHIAVYGLVFQRDNCYVVGVKLGEAKLRIWDNQQLLSIRVLDDRFEMPSHFSLERSDVAKLLEEARS